MTEKQLYICPEAKDCCDGCCPHAVPHDPEKLNDRCTTDPCPYGDELEVAKKIYCILHLEIKLEKELFEI